MERKQGKHTHDKVVNHPTHMIRSNIPETHLECMPTLEISPRGGRCNLVAFPTVVVMLFEFTLLGPSDLPLVASTVW